MMITPQFREVIVMTRGSSKAFRTTYATLSQVVGDRLLTTMTEKLQSTHPNSIHLSRLYRTATSISLATIPRQPVDAQAT